MKEGENGIKNTFFRDYSPPLSTPRPSRGGGGPRADRWRWRRDEGTENMEGGRRGDDGTTGRCTSLQPGQKRGRTSSSRSGSPPSVRPSVCPHLSTRPSPVFKPCDWPIKELPNMEAGLRGTRAEEGKDGDDWGKESPLESPRSR